jgi:hypothetical protein
LLHEYNLTGIKEQLMATSAAPPRRAHFLPCTAAALFCQVNTKAQPQMCSGARYVKGDPVMNKMFDCGMIP